MVGTKAGGLKLLGNKHSKKHGMSNTPEYKAWENARSRCYIKKNIKYPLYGAKGITMCARWVTSFTNFLEDMGRKPAKNYTLDRINSKGNYEPGNCRWATYKDQNNNRSINIWINLHGKKVTIAQASILTGIPHSTIISRIDRGWPMDMVVSKNAKKTFRMARQDR